MWGGPNNFFFQGRGPQTLSPCKNCCLSVFVYVLRVQDRLARCLSVFVYVLRVQDRLARCTMHCSDKAKDLFDSGAKEPAVRALMDRCVGSCVDDHMNLVPSMTRRLRDNLDAIPQ